VIRKKLIEVALTFDARLKPWEVAPQ